MIYFVLRSCHGIRKENEPPYLCSELLPRSWASPVRRTECFFLLFSGVAYHGIAPLSERQFRAYPVFPACQEVVRKNFFGEGASLPK
jgi:hypothetical protein